MPRPDKVPIKSGWGTNQPPLLRAELAEPALHVFARGFATTEAKGQCESDRDRDRAEGETKGEVHDIVSESHAAQSHRKDEAENREAGNARGDDFGHEAQHLVGDRLEMTMKQFLES